MNLDDIITEVDSIRTAQADIDALRGVAVPNDYAGAHLHVKTIESKQLEVETRWATLRAVVDDAAPAARPRKRSHGVVAAVRAQIQEWEASGVPWNSKWWRDWAAKRKLNPASVAKAARVEMAKARAAAEAE